MVAERSDNFVGTAATVTGGAAASVVVGGAVGLELPPQSGRAKAITTMAMTTPTERSGHRGNGAGANIGLILHRTPRLVNPGRMIRVRNRHTHARERSMDSVDRLGTLGRVGRILFGLSLVAFGIQQLLYVRGFDPQAKKYKYEVNQRFGATRPAFSAFTM